MTCVQGLIDPAGRPASTKLIQQIFSFQAELQGPYLSDRSFHPRSSMRHRGDFQLLRWYVDEHDQDAFRQLVNRYLDVVFSFARRQVRDAHLAEDVSQLVFTRLGAKARLVSTRDSLRSWLLAATRYAALDAIKHRKRRWRHERGAARSRTSCAKPDSEFLATGIRESSERGDYFTPLDADLRKALCQLSPISRDAVVSRFLENKTYREVAQQLDLTEQAARQRVSRSLGRLRKILGARGCHFPRKISTLSS